MSHERARARVAGLVAVSVAASAVALGGSAGATQEASSGAAPAPALGATVTLLTGDRVTLGGPDGAVVRAAKGRERIGFVRRVDERGHVHVIPRDAVTSVSSGRLDPRLFDVSELARTGYGDAKRADLPLIVDYPGATPRTAGTEVVRELPAVGAVAVRANKDATFWARTRTAAKRIWLDGPVRASLDHSVPQIGAPQAWAAGHTGEGTTVAVLDTGIDATHPDLADAVTEARDFSESESGTDDLVGHGTHVASIITGAGGKYTGVAPDAKLLNGKVLDDSGSGSESGIIAGMEWAAASGADVVNMSLGSDLPSDGTDPMSLAVNRLTEQTGSLFVVAAGNNGPGSESIGSPAAADAALTVGAVDREDQLAEFSSRGPRWVDGAIKPDITAPGVDIVAAKAANGQIGEPVEDGYVSLSGTSMAAPHVAGSAAIVAGQHPEWTVDRLKSTLMASAKPNADLSVFEQGAGRVDVAAAVESTVSASPASISAGTAQWPHADDEPIAKTLAYTNSGAEPITLDLATDVRDPGGDPAPAGMFTVEPSRVTVPAGGRAEVTLTIDTTVSAPDGTYDGVVTATAGDVAVRTPITVNREVESYDVTIKTLDHDGRPTPEYGVRLVDVADPQAYLPYDESGTVVARLPKGRYYFEAGVQTLRGDEYLLTEKIEPAFVVRGDSELVVDARQGRELDFRVDEPTAKEAFGDVSYTLRTDWGVTGTALLGADFETYFTTPSKTSAGERFEFGAAAQLAEPDGTDTFPGFEGSPYLYHLRWTQDGRVPAKLARTFHDRRLARVESVHGFGTPGLIGVRNDVVTGPLPFSLTEYYTPDEPFFDYFYDAVSQQDEFDVFLTDASERVYRKGTVTHVEWNTGVFGPAFPVSDFGPQVARLGDELDVAVPLFTDQDPKHFGSAAATGTTELLRDGEVVGEEPRPGGGRFVLPPEEATYTLRTTADRTPGARLSTKVSAEWTFRSGTVAGEEPAAVPLLAVRFAPDLDGTNAAPAGERFRIPVYVQRVGSAKPGRVDTPRVEISYDDGKSWARVPVREHGDRWVAVADHPAGAEFAALRSSVSDVDGHTATQTILRAYALR
ncbi:MAG: S8 family peptidase [Actinophytocola sp.]|uniref:S8 family peptidase n=1 Tax=Actinophytocola sp. TaxID=1872138 RepID=UPI003D6A1FC8